MLMKEVLSSDSSDPFRRPVGEFTITYDRKKAVDYANKWTSEGTGNNGSSYNSTQFKYFKEGNDCQNYVSQCIWAGFGGTTSEPVDGTPYPPLIRKVLHH